MAENDPHINGSPGLSSHNETVALPQISSTKEQRDLVLASEALRLGILNERQLKSALANWSIHGTIPLADHLSSTGLLTSADRERLDSASSLQFATLHANPSAPGSSSLSSVIQHIDRNGRVARLLGIATADSLDSTSQRSALVRHTLVRKLGQGGLGTVWLSRDEHMQRFVALKEMRRDENVSPAAIARFCREAEITAKLEHPGIVPVYVFGEDRDTRRVFYTMRFLGKQTLQDSIVEYHERRTAGDHDPLLLRNLLTAFVSICQALGHAHSRKIIHRDLKPENVAIDSFGQVIVIDWGLAKVLDETSSLDNSPELLDSLDAESHHTAAGQVLGTPLYMAPEQATGRLEEIDERTDVFGLGAILFAILTGEAPHERSIADSNASGVRSLIAAIAAKPTPLARNVNLTVDPALEAICAKAMARHRYNRYQSATQLADEIQRWMAAEPVLAFRESRSKKIERWIRQHRRLSQFLATLGIVALVTGISFLLNSYSNLLAARQARFAELKSQLHEIDLQLASRFDHLTKNVRYMSNLPPIARIIAAGNNPKIPAAIPQEDSEESRLELIYEGLLRVNSDYLSVSFFSLEKDSERQIVRVERQSTDPSYLRRVRKSPSSKHTPNPLLGEIATLGAGEVKLLIDGSTNSRRPDPHPHLLGRVPVYDHASGNLFGAVIVETDIAADAQNILDQLRGQHIESFITDQNGSLLASFRPDRGSRIESTTSSITTLLPQTQPYFASTNPDDELSLPGDGIAANRVHLNRLDSSGSLAIVLRLLP